LLDSHPRFPRGGRAVFPQRPASGGRKRTRVGSARFAFSCVESFSFSYRSPRPRRGRVKPSEAAGSTEQWGGDEEKNNHGLDHRLKSFHGRRRAASPLSDRNKKRKLVVGGKTRLVECDSTEEPYSIGALARYN